MKQWYYISPGHQAAGPLGERELQNKLRRGELDQLRTFVWRPGLQEWLPFDESELNPAGVIHITAPKPPPPIPSEEELAEQAARMRSGELQQRFGGINRSHVWLGPISVVLALVAVGRLGFENFTLRKILLENRLDNTAWWVLVLMLLIVFFIPLWLRFDRLKNLAMRRWMVVLELIPVANVWLWWRCYCCPEGYAIHRKLDPLGLLLSVAFIMPWSLAILGVIWKGEGFLQWFIQLL